MQRHYRPLAALLISLMLGSEAPASSDGAFLDDELNLSPVSLLFAVEPVPGEPVRGWRIDVRAASHAASDSDPDASLLFDGETALVGLAAGRRLTPRLAVGAYLPYLWHSGGTLDGFIDDWHRWFGFPEGIRDEVPNGELRFALRQNDNDVFDLRRNRHGIGDLRLRAHLARDSLSDDRWSLAFALKLPTGDADKLTGSGATDVSVTLNWRHQPQTAGRWLLNAAAGAAWLGDADLAFDRQRRLTWMGQASAVYRVSDTFALGGRLQMHGGLVEGGPSAIGDPSMLLVVGGSYRFTDRWQLQVTVGEDVRVESAPDVTFRLSLARVMR